MKRSLPPSPSGIWFTFVSAYTWLSFRATLSDPKARWPEFVTDGFSILVGFVIWTCFLVLEKEIETKDQRSPYWKAVGLAGGIGIFVLLVSILDRQRGLGLFGLACHGLYNGLALACLAGRLGSHHMNIRNWKLLALYFYAMIQLYYVFFDVLEQSWVWVIFIAGFILKGILGITGLDLIENENLYRYFKKITAGQPISNGLPIPSGPIQVLGNFPAFLPNIIKAIDEAPPKSEIRIACDYVSYGMSSAGGMYDDYRNALLRARSRECTIRMLVLGSEPWRQMGAQVPDQHEQEFENLKGTAVFKKSLDTLGDRVRQLDLPDLPPRVWKRASQLAALVQVEGYYDRMLRGVGIHITIVRGPLPLYLWITESSVIWVLCPLEPRMRFPLMWYDVLAKGKIDPDNPLDEHGFLSCDERLVHRFTKVWDQYSAVESRAAATGSGGAS